MKEILDKGDEVVVHALDRLGRNKEEIKNELAWFKEHGIVVRILNVPTTLIEYPVGQEWVMEMVNNILIEVLGAVAQQEREDMLTRQAEAIAVMPVDEEGYKISKKTGRRFGREKKCPDNFLEVYQRQQRGEITLKEALTMLFVNNVPNLNMEYMISFDEVKRVVAFGKGWTKKDPSNWGKKPDSALDLILILDTEETCGGIAQW